ncbi:MAG: efflux RND transporter permease subunit [Candidatus Aminicenantes bacterium]|nr:efflux RND transporter permease subunit [Candidatus Aminicenantes bacterium]
MEPKRTFVNFAGQHSLLIIFMTIVLCMAGVYAALSLPSSVFPKTDFPRVVLLIDNGVMPSEEMMATITRPIEEAMKDIPGVTTIRSATGRGSAEVNVFFNWQVDMIKAELFVLGRLAQIRGTLPTTTDAKVFRATFSNFPMIGVSLTSSTRSITDLWEIARYEIKPRFLRIPDVARVNLVGGCAPEFHVVVDPLRLHAAGLTLTQVTDAFEKNNLIASSGMHEENHMLYLTVVDGRVHTIKDIEDFIVMVSNSHPVRIRDIAVVQRGPEPVFNVVTADGRDAVLLNIHSQPDGSILDIAKGLHEEIGELKRHLSPDLKLAFFYDQSLIVRSSVASVWEAIFFGLFLSILILYFFLKNWGTTMIATLVIPVTVLVTLLAMKFAGLSFNLMTLGGIAAAIGLIIDDAIVVVEAIHTNIRSGLPKSEAIGRAIAEIYRPLVGSTLTPVVVFVPLAFLDGLTGVFFRSLALTMVVALLMSLVLAVTLTPALAAFFIRAHAVASANAGDAAGPLLTRVIAIYERAVRAVLKRPRLTLAVCGLIILAGIGLYLQLKSEFLPEMDEGGFVIDYLSPPGTSLAETHHQLLKAERILKTIPELESFSRRTGARLALAVCEPNNGDFLVKLKPNRSRSTAEVIAELRNKFNQAVPDMNWEFPGILGDLIGDLMWSPQPIEVKLFSKDSAFLKKKASEIEKKLKTIPGVVDTYNGLVSTGPTIGLHVRYAAAQRFGISSDDIAAAVNIAMLGRTASSVLEGDRVVDIRVKVEPVFISRLTKLRELPLRAADGALIKLSQVADIVEEPGQYELRRDDLRQDVAITGRLEGRDLGSAMNEIRAALENDTSIPAGSIEYGGLYEQQRESFFNLLVVLVMAILLVFTVLLVEFGSFYEPIAIVFGAILAIFGSILALWFTGTSLNVVSFLGAIIGVGIVAKNGILMLDFVNHLRGEGHNLTEALVRSGRRRLRPVLMTSLAAALGMLPLAYGIGSGADMLKPLAIAVIGALCISVLLSLLATPVLYLLLQNLFAGHTKKANIN